jgi:signal recognition particle GTPase
MHTQKNLLMEIKRYQGFVILKKKYLFGESITGNNSIEQVKSFE